MKILVFVAAVMVWSTAAFAQAGPGKSMAWDQSGATVAEANAYTFKMYADGASVGVALAPVTCAQPAASVECVALFPAFTPGAHTLQLTAANAAGEGPKSAVFSFTFVVVPNAPASIRIR